jgi:hypothetical protein
MSHEGFSRKDLTGALLAITMMADPHCRSPRKRLREIRRLCGNPGIDKLRLAKILLTDVEREDSAAPQNPTWRKATRAAARVSKRRKVAER